MTREEIVSLRSALREQLESSARFWLQGLDPVNGGIFTCLTREGKVYTTDKSVWMQGRAPWTYARLCRQYGARPEWLQAAKSCLDFSEAHCFVPGGKGKMAFSVTAEGSIRSVAEDGFSEAFYMMACAEMARASGEKAYLEKARRTLKVYLRLAEREPAKVFPGIRPYRAFGTHMILLGALEVLEDCDPDHREEYAALQKRCVERMLPHFDRANGCIRENILPDGSFDDCSTEGRLVNPGHGIEGVWFLLEYARRRGEVSLVTTAREIFDADVSRWLDPVYGGLYYFGDALGYPPELYMHDMKAWWPQCELLIASLMLYRDTGEEDYLNLFRKEWAYCLSRFADPEYGEWFRILHRDGSLPEPREKGSAMKGPFHVPRMLMAVDSMLEEMERSL